MGTFIIMVLPIIYLVVVISSVESYWLPLRTFPGPHVHAVHGYGGVVGYQYPQYPQYPQFRALPLQRVVSYLPYTQYNPLMTAGYQSVRPNIVSNQPFHRSSFDFGRRNFVRGKIPSNKFTSGNIVENAKAQAESTLTLLDSFKGSAIAAQYMNPIFETSECLNNLEDVTNLIQEGTNLIVENEPEILYLEAIVEFLKGETDINKMIKASSKMLRTLDRLGPALAAGASNLCISSPEDSVKSLRDLSNVLVDISINKNFNVPPRSRELLEINAEIMDQTASFLETLNKSLETFKSNCQSGSNNQTAIYDTTRDILNSLAELFESMGFEENSTEIKKQSEFIKKFVDNYAGIEDLDLDLECSLVGDYTALAQTLDDLAEIIKLVGIEKLYKELGIDLDFNGV